MTYRPRSRLHVACFVAALGYAQWTEQMRRAIEIPIDDPRIAYLHLAHQHFGKAVDLLVEGRTIGVLS